MGSSADSTCANWVARKNASSRRMTGMIARAGPGLRWSAPALLERRQPLGLAGPDAAWNPGGARRAISDRPSRSAEAAVGLGDDAAGRSGGALPSPQAGFRPPWRRRFRARWPASAARNGVGAAPELPSRSGHLAGLLVRARTVRAQAQSALARSLSRAVDRPVPADAAQVGQGVDRQRVAGLQGPPARSALRGSRGRHRDARAALPCSPARSGSADPLDVLFGMGPAAVDAAPLGRSTVRVGSFGPGCHGVDLLLGRSVRDRWWGSEREGRRRRQRRSDAEWTAGWPTDRGLPA